MFAKLKEFIAEILAEDGAEGPGAPSLPSRTIRDSGESQTSEQDHEPASYHDLRRRLVEGEHTEDVQSTSGHTVQIIPAGLDNPTTREKRSFTEEGMVTVVEDTLLEGADGRLIKAPELHQGGRCSFGPCARLTDKLIFCPVCRRGFCQTHSIQWKDIRVCPVDYRRLRFEDDTWDTRG